MAGPWEKYQTGGKVDTATADGPWKKYSSGSKLSEDDRASPIPDALIEKGKDVVDDANKKSFGEAGTTWLEHAISDLPIIGPALQTGSDYLGTEIMGRLSGQDPAQMREEIWSRREQRDENYPLSAASGALGGNLAAFGGAGATATGARALGISGENLLARAGASAASTGSISAADTAARGGDGYDMVQSGVVGSIVGGGIPIAGELVKQGVRAVGDRVAPALGAMRDAGKEAERRVGVAMARDKSADPASVMSAADEAAAREAGVPLSNVDRGGETTRALARSVANQSPEARSAIENVANDRFSAQSQRASEFIRSLTGEAADDIAVQEKLRNAAAKANKPAYDKAYAEGADLIKTPEMERLMSSPAVVDAMKATIKKGKDRAVKSGFGSFNPAISVTDDGRIVFNKTKAGGGDAFPDLQFWDYTKRELDDAASAAARAGRSGEAETIGGLSKSLREELDRVVPSYKEARAGAATFFGVEDALEAGKKFATSPKQVPEARKAFAKFSEPEKAAFATGYASELIDRVRASGDRTNVINSVFKNQAARDSMDLVFGPVKMKRVEAYVRVEDLADRLRGAMGNSTTARQLVELGIGAGGGYAASGGDWKGAAAGALMAKGARVANAKINDEVMKRIGKLLISDDPKALQTAVSQASMSPKYMKALEDLSALIAVPSRATAVAAGQ